MIKAEITTKKGCAVEIEGFAENILKELFAVIPFIITTVLKRLNLPEEANKEIESILDEICTSEAEKRDIMKQFTGELKNKKLIDDDLC